MSVDWAKLTLGEDRSFEIADINRTHFVRYAGASGDLNPIHHDQTFAEKAGLPTVFGLGMFTAGVLSRIVSEWFGPEAIKRYAVRFATRLWPGDTIRFSGKITRVYVDDDSTHADLELSAVNQKGESLVLGEATVRRWKSLDSPSPPSR